MRDAETERTAILVSPYPEATGMAWGKPGNHIGWISDVVVRPEVNLTRTAFLVRCESLGEARAYASDLRIARQASRKLIDHLVHAETCASGGVLRSLKRLPLPGS